MATAISMIAEQVLNACCADKADFFPFGKKPSAAETEVKNESVTKKKFLNQHMKFELSEWKKLPPKARKACESLGYDETKWDNSEDVEVSWKHWEDLTDEEREAVEILGWEETAWETKYESEDWEDLPDLQKKAAKSVGYTEDTWDEWLDSLDKAWDDLAQDEKEAMCVMGWTKATWDH